MSVHFWVAEQSKVDGETTIANEVVVMGGNCLHYITLLRDDSPVISAGTLVKLRKIDPYLSSIILALGLSAFILVLRISPAMIPRTIGSAKYSATC